jgi:hypothetical protein
MDFWEERLLILANTYPMPSTRYRETNCIAAINDKGQLRRLFPVPFRLLEESSRFKKWEWITAPITRALERVNDLGTILDRVTGCVRFSA